MVCLMYRAPGAISPRGQADKSSHRQHRRHAAHAQDVHDREAVFPGQRVVVETKQKKPIYRRADFILRCLDERKLQFLRRKIYSEKIARDFPIRGENHNAARMRVVFARGIVKVMKPDFIRDAPDGFFAAGEKMPARLRTRSPVAAEISLFFRHRLVRRFVWINAEMHDLEIFADVEPQLLQTFNQAAGNRRAKHRTAVVTRHEHDRFWFMRIIRECDPAPRFIKKRRYKRNPLAEFLIKANAAKLLIRRRVRTCGEYGEEQQAHFPATEHFRCLPERSEGSRKRPSSVAWEILRCAQEDM